MKHTEGRDALAAAMASVIQESHEVVEAMRLARVHKANILDTAPEPEYDDLVNLAAYLCGAQVGVLTFIDETRSWPKAKVGIVVDESPREHSFCNIAIKTPQEMLVIEDSLQDERTRNSPWADSSRDSLRFYAGVPLVTDDGYALGALCVCDREPRTISQEQADHLRALARVASRLINSRG